MKGSDKENEANIKGNDAEKRKKIMEMINKNINRKHFSENRLEAFFDQCFSLESASSFVDEDKKF